MMHFSPEAAAHPWLGKLLDPWEWLGVGAQLCFAGRFAYQWWKSEKAGAVVLPVFFWYLSLCGASLLIVYLVHKDAWALVLAQSIAILFYLRNLVLGGRKKKS